MEQDFNLVAPRARLTEHYGNPMGEILFGLLWDRTVELSGLSNTAEHLVDLLAVPVLRKGDRKPVLVESQDTRQNYCSHGQDQCNDVIVAIGINHKASAEISTNHLPKKAEHGGQTDYFRSVTLCNLPTEILLIIMDYIESIGDVVSLGLVNKRLCCIAQERLRFHFHRHFAPWANENIVCVGDHCGDPTRASRK